jgi:phosphoribosylformylglycinamidine synthase
MPRYKVVVQITLRKGILDSAGKAVLKALKSLGFDGVNDVRIGKELEIFIDANDFRHARKQVEEILKKGVVNPVMEDYTIISARKQR